MPTPPPEQWRDYDRESLKYLLRQSRSGVTRWAQDVSTAPPDYSNGSWAVPTNELLCWSTCGGGYYRVPEVTLAGAPWFDFQPQQ